MRVPRLAISILLLLAAVLLPLPCSAQIDPVQRRLLELGFNQPMQGRGPVAGYAYYYFNEPNYPRTNQTLRLALAPVYLDGELGFHGALGPQTDLALGLAGGGFAESYSEIRGGHYFREESFTGHGGNISASVYHLFNPGQLVPLNAVLRFGVHQTVFERDEESAAGFVLPPDQTTLSIRSGLRFGGREPLLVPNAAMELSLWYEGQFRETGGSYGFAGDRRINSESHLFWGRALLEYTLPDSGHNFNFAITTGISLNADRFSSFRLGAALPLNAEFPLNLPGYYYQEISARRFVLLGGLYSVPLDAARQWSVSAYGATTTMDYVRGLEQPGNWHSSVGGGLGYQSRDKAWQVVLGYAYGVDAIRTDGRGAHTVGLLLQYDLGARRGERRTKPDVGPEKSRFLQRLFSR